MNFAFNAEQEELRESARAFLLAHSSPEQVRAAMECELGFDPEVWKRIGQELGWTALLVPEAYGGLELSHVELVALLEQTGAALLCAPLFSTVCLAGTALLEAGSETQQKEHLPAIAAGEKIAALVFGDDVELVVERDGADHLLSGGERFVLDGHCADLLVVAARAPGTRGAFGVSLFVLPADTAGIERRVLPTLDQTRRLAEVRFDRVRVPANARLGEEGGAWPALERTLELAAVALSAEQVGGAQRCLDLAVEYAKERVQFGRPIGSFQAIKHKCADMMVRVESARSASYYAACAAAAGSEELPVVSSLAKAYCSDAYLYCASECLQIHGGVGFTWEYDVHLYLKRARSTASFLGDSAWHRERIAQRIGL